MKYLCLIFDSDEHHMPKEHLFNGNHDKIADTILSFSLLLYMFQSYPNQVWACSEQNQWKEVSLHTQTASAAITFP